MKYALILSPISFMSFLLFLLVLTGCPDPKDMKRYGLAIGDRVIVQNKDDQKYNGKEGVIIDQWPSAQVKIRLDEGGEQVMRMCYLKRISADPGPPESVSPLSPNGTIKKSEPSDSVVERFRLGGMVKLSLTGQKAQVIEVKDTYTPSKNLKYRNYKVRVADKIDTTIDASDFELEP